MTKEDLEAIKITLKQFPHAIKDFAPYHIDRLITVLETSWAENTKLKQQLAYQEDVITQYASQAYLPKVETK